MKTKTAFLWFTFVALLSTGVAHAQTADGYRLPQGWPHPLHDRTINYMVLFEKFEFRTGQAEDAAVIDAQGWVGGDYHRLWWKAEGEQERRSPKTGEFEVQALYGRLIHPFWDVQAGVRLDRRYSGPNRETRGHLAFGLQGVAPYWFELEPTLFLSDEGDFSFKLEASYEQLITQRWVIEPRMDLAAAAQDDRGRGIGAGLTDVEFGLRLRYEFTRQFAPYIGVTWSRALGESAGLRRRAGEHVSQSAVVLGIRTWF
jgi:copper resistance protein B